MDRISFRKSRSFPFLFAGALGLPCLVACDDSSDTKEPAAANAGAGGADEAPGPDPGSAGTASAGAPQAAGASGGTDPKGSAGSSGAPGIGGASTGGSASGGAPGFVCPDPEPNAASGAGGGGPVDCAVPPQGDVVGWAAVAGADVETTTGGGDGAPVIVTTAEEFTAAIAGIEPRVVHVAGNICGSFAIGSNKTIAGCGGTVTGHLGLEASVNVIVRNLTIVGMNCTDSPADCSDGSDAVSVRGGSHHVWFDHDDISDGSDGNLDVTDRSDFVTISWTKFHYSTLRTNPADPSSGHRFSNLIGSDDDVVPDEGHLNVTFHHNWWADNVNQRMPRARYGKIHLFNNLYTAAGSSYCIGVGMAADVRSENNVFIGVNTPINTTSYQDERSLATSVGNIYTGTTGNVVADIGVAFEPTYDYTLEPAEGVESAVRSGAGPE